MLEFLLGPTNPTTDWQRASDLRLTFDLKGGKLNDVGIGEPLNRLSFLGPVEDRSGLKTGEYRFFHSAFRLTATMNRVPSTALRSSRKTRTCRSTDPFLGFAVRGRES